MTPREAFRSHRSSAKKRGIPFEMTFREWWEMWAPHFSQRGVRRHEMQMCRTGDTGPYAPYNVRIDTASKNHAEAKITGLSKAIDRDWKFDGRDQSGARGWVYGRNVFGADYFRQRELQEVADERRAREGLPPRKVMTQAEADRVRLAYLADALGVSPPKQERRTQFGRRRPK